MHSPGHPSGASASQANGLVNRSPSMPAGEHRMKLLSTVFRSFGVAVLAFAASASPGLGQGGTGGNRLNVYVAGTAGGGADTYARLLGRHIGQYLPGKPTVVVQNMPGAGGIRAANFMAEAAPRDGSAVALFVGGPLLEPLIGARNPGYDMSQFNWIGAISRDVSLCFSWSAAPFKTLDDVKQKEMVVAGTGAGSETDTFPVILNELLNTRFKVVTGYLGTNETYLAIESGEAHGRCGSTYSSLKSTKADWLRDRKINVLVQFGLEKSPELPDVPLVRDLVPRQEDKQLVDFLVATTAIGRAVGAPPGTPNDKVEALRRAFDDTMKDAAFLSEARTIQAEISPTRGEDVQKVIATLYATPKPISERAKALLGTGDVKR
jgi:tripartite-type tricarboxylate transporter receptor subunit TctC